MRMGSVSPRSAEPRAVMAWSTVVLLNDARSAASPTSSVEKSTSSSPPRPAALPKMPNVCAAVRACCLDWPRPRAALRAKASSCRAESAPNTCSMAEPVSDRSDAALMADTAMPPMTPMTPVATRDACSTLRENY